MLNKRFNPFTGNFDLGVQRQEFEATPGQTEFTVTDFSLTDQYAVFVDGVLQADSYSSRVVQVITLPAQAEGTIISIVN